MRAHEIIWSPNPGRQTSFLRHGADELLLGGEAGGGKSDALVVLPLRWVEHRGFRALILRREAVDLGPLLAKAHRVYRRAFPAARYHESTRTWRFPSGATIRFSGCEHERDAFAFQGDEFNVVAFDELTHFTRGQYLEITSRLRTTDASLPTIVRATSNPGGPGHDWVLERWAPWLDPTTEIDGLDRGRYADRRADEAQTLWFVRDEHGRESVCDARREGAVSRSFLRSTRAECVQLSARYEAQLAQLDPVRRAQLARGDWQAKPSAGRYFQRAWVSFVEGPPSSVERRVRYWDLAAGGDWAVGVKSSRALERHVIEDVRRARAGPGEVRRLLFETAREDGPSVELWIERDPGQAGKDQEHTYVTAPELRGFSVRFRPKRIDKISAFAPFSAYAYASEKLVHLVRASWNRALLDELEAFPEGAHDDQCDAVSGAHAVLFGEPPPPEYGFTRIRSTR